MSNPVSRQPDETPSVSEESSFAELLAEFERQRPADAQPGEVLEGIVVSAGEEGVLVDIGRKREGILPAELFRGPEGRLNVNIGDRLTVAVTGRSAEGYYALSTVRVKRPTDWSALEQARLSGSVIAGTVREVIKGGLSVDVGVRAFLPASRSGARDAAEMEALLGQEIRCKIIQLDTAKEDVVVDRRVVLEEEAAAARERRFSSLQEGDVVTGVVRSLTDFGAFIDLGGIDGLLHVTDMAWTRVNKPSEVLAEGETVEVKILKIDRESRRISLGRKQLVPDPWSLAEQKYPAGTRVRGKVVRLADFGAFVELEPGVDGLIHVSEMSWSKKQRKPSEILRAGEMVEAVVLAVNAAERRASLGLKQVLGDPWESVEERHPPGSVVEGKVTNLAKFGAFVELGEGVEGMIHIGDISGSRQLKHPREALEQGQTVRALVLGIDRERRRIRLGLKQLEPTPADEYIAEHKTGDVVSGRVVEVAGETAKIELGEGVAAVCRISAARTQDAEGAGATAGRADLGQLTAMLAAKWKQGSSPRTATAAGLRAGQVRSFRITALDPGRRSIEVEPAN
jgi:small subunit ribosomal protein S1